MKAIDLYSGIGGWTLGLKMAGIEVVDSFEWWDEANRTHNNNFGKSIPERDIRKLKMADLPAFRKISNEGLVSEFHNNN
jgi:DNA (cytosine-5)-methyltransferase 1